ncbi:hypothetical protein [Kaarinaea lacus]
MGNETLKKLARDYARGQIHKYDYRHMRTRLIDEITGDDLIDEEPATAPYVSQPGHDESVRINPAKQHVKKVILFAVAVLAIIIAIITFAINRNDQDKQSEHSSQLIPGNARQLISRFMGYEDWTAERISQFVAGWQSLPEPQKQQAQQAEWFQELISNMKQRLTEQQTLAKIGSQDARQNEQRILQLADLLGIRL